MKLLNNNTLINQFLLGF